MTWDSAVTYCDANDAILSTVESAEKQTTVSRYLDGEGERGELWLGGKKGDTGWRWQDDTPYSKLVATCSAYNKLVMTLCIQKACHSI